MPDIPQAAVDAAARAVDEWFGHDGDLSVTMTEVSAAMVRVALEAAEAAWPHAPQQRDPASTVAAGMNLATPAKYHDGNIRKTPARQHPQPHCFGFGPPEVRA